MNIADILGHSTNLLYLFAFALRDILWMRFAMIIAAIVDIGYCFLGTNNPWTGTPWALMAIAVNGYHFIKLLYDRGTIDFNPDEREIHHHVFSLLNRVQFKHLIAIAHWHTFSDRAEIIKQGVESKDLWLIVEGTASVEVNATPVVSLDKYHFVGEMSFLTGEPTTASVSAIGTVRCLVWRGEELRRLMKRETDLDVALNAVFNKVLIKKLTNTTEISLMFKSSNSTASSDTVVRPFYRQR